MKNYKVFKHPDGRMEAVKQGWSWPGFFFGIIWALVKKLWGVAGILFAIWLVLLVISIALEPDPYSYSNYSEYNNSLNTLNIWDLVSNVIGLGIAIYLGVQGNSLRESNLINKGYEFISTEFAANPDMAIIETKKTNNDNNNKNNSNTIYPI